MAEEEGVSFLSLFKLIDFQSRRRELTATTGMKVRAPLPALPLRPRTHSNEEVEGGEEGEGRINSPSCLSSSSSLGKEREEERGVGNSFSRPVAFSSSSWALSRFTYMS